MNSIIYHIRGIGLSEKHANLIKFLYESYGSKEIHLSLRKISKSIGYDFTAVGKYLKSLESHGLITSGGTDKKRVYKVNVELLEGLLRG
ncbi:MAG: hypothetical protein H6Q14_770 [Bacteroidetes bacterium]|nr:hypothetical protein [Bacteroidota bacterium]